MLFVFSLSNGRVVRLPSTALVAHLFHVFHSIFTLNLHKPSIFLVLSSQLWYILNIGSFIIAVPKLYVTYQLGFRT